MQQVATIERLWRYPVKSMAGQDLEQVEVEWQGLVGDRRWAFVFEDDHSRFPWVTGRRAPEMILLRPDFADPDDPDHSEIVVHGPNGQVRPLDDPTLAEELATRTKRPVRLMRSGRGLFDAFPVSLISTGTAGEIADHRRFRPNLLVEAEAFAEEAWIGRTLQLGEGDAAPRIRLDERDERCVMITLDPDTAEADPNVQRTVARDRENCLGVYGSVARTGVVRLGDPVLLLD
jgi:uncharacterized protein